MKSFWKQISKMMLPVRGLDRPMVSIGLASAALAITYVLATPNPQDDVYSFNRFVKTAVHEGRIDLTIPCLQGISFFAIPIYWLARMEQPVIFTNALLTVFIPIAAFLAGRAWFGEKVGMVVVALVLFQPYEVLTVLRGWNRGPQMLFLFLVLWLLKREDRFSSLGAGFIWGAALCSRPFSLALFPLFIARRKYFAGLLGISLAALYVGVEYLQQGFIWRGCHAQDDPAHFFWLDYELPSRIYLLTESLLSFETILATKYDFNVFHTNPFLFVPLVFFLLSPKTLGHSLSRKEFMGCYFAVAASLVLPSLLPAVDFWYLVHLEVLVLLLSAFCLLRNPKFVVIFLLSVPLFLFQAFGYLGPMFMPEHTWALWLAPAIGTALLIVQIGKSGPLREW